MFRCWLTRIHTHTYIYIYIYIHTYIHIHIYIFVVNFDALAQASDFRIERRQVVFPCWMQDSNPEGFWKPIFSRLNTWWQTDCAIEDQAKKNLNSIARPKDQQAFSPPDPTAIWHSHLALAIYIFVVVHFDALAQASDFRMERRQVVFLCWMQDSNPEGLWSPIFSRLNACWQTDLATWQTNWVIKDQAKKTWKTWTRQPVPMINKHSAHLTPLPFGIRTWLWRHTYLLLLISMLWHSQAIFESKGDKLSSSAECRIVTQRVSEAQCSADWMPADKPTELSMIKLKKTWTQQPVPMISKHSAHLTLLPFDIRSWLWRHSYLLLFILTLWHRQAIFESKGDKLSSSAECRIRTQRVSETQSSADWMPADKPTGLSMIKLKKQL